MILSPKSHPRTGIFKGRSKYPFECSWLLRLALQSKLSLFGLIGLACAQVASATDVATYWVGPAFYGSDHWALNWTITSDNTAVPGTYTFATMFNGVEAANCRFSVTVFADHTVSPTFVQPYPLAGRRGDEFPDQTIVFTTQLVGAPANYDAAGQHAGASEGNGAAVYVGTRVDCPPGGPCNPHDVGVPGTVSIGGAPAPADAETTCDALQVGGNAENCATCRGGQTAGANTHGMARYSVHSKLVSLNIRDTPLRYSPPYGPSIDFTATYNQKESQQPALFTYSNLGPKWTFDWLSYVSDDPNVQLPLTGLYRSGGGAEIFAYDSASQSFLADRRSHATLVKTGRPAMNGECLTARSKSLGRVTGRLPTRAAFS
jgi:hypothetical protein